MVEEVQFTSLFSEIHLPDGRFRTSAYSWLGSDWRANKWMILDPHNPDLDPEWINFDVPAIPGQTFMDLTEVMEDIKRSIAIAVELRTVLKRKKQGVYCNSRSSIRRFGQNLLRIYREILDMGFQGASQLDELHLLELRDRLLYPERISRAYPEKLLKIIEEVGIDALPVKINQNRKFPCHIDKSRLQLMAGIGDWRLSVECRQIVNDVTRELAEKKPEYRWEELDVPDQADFVSKVQARNYGNALKLLHMQSQLLKDDFVFPLQLDPFADESPADFVEGAFARHGHPTRPCRGRTRNMPVRVFLKLMDASVRWVIDYADPLLTLEEQIAIEVNELEGGLGNGRVRRIANARVRELSSESEWVGKPCSPFPLASFRHSRSASDSKYDDDFVAEVKTLLDEGLAASETGARLGISKPSVEFIKRRYINDRDSHSLQTTGVSLNYALYSLLPFCCSVILLAFTAGRESSIGDLRSGCIKRIAGLRYINLYIPKTLRRYEDLPTVELVEKAVGVLERLSASAREKTGSDRLFQFEDLVGDRVKGVRFDNVYPSFFDLIDMPRDEDGGYWKLSEHQFRRFFAIMYFYRYGKDNDSDFESLMYHLRHCDWSMTDRYLTEEEQGRIFREVEEEWLSYVIVTGKPVDQSLQSLMVDVDDVKRSVVDGTMIAREKDAERVLKRVQEDSLVFEFLSFGAVCLGLSPGRAEIAKCAIEIDGEPAPRLHKASESLCSGCPNYVACDSMISSKTSEKSSLTPLACKSPILDAVLLEVEPRDA
ncbi:hypothetical protein DET61_101219 [Marinobacter nauticus]|uniref:Uncharacterized protein n=1 Tax=Marinobacter nauticus TaxID=2743 RepID=A0A368YAK3_MARNT|nr:hypothetical protein [Marinobacter nauticus]RCW75224.1 hypothetical protein DET61_101219 [Marinobacter nauticus]